MKRVPPLGLLGLLVLLGCGAAEIQETPAEDQAGVEIRCLWLPPEGGYEEPILVGGIKCMLARQGGGALYEDITQPAEPLRIQPVQPGTYALTIRGRDMQGAEREYEAPSFEVAAGRLVTVQLDLTIAKDAAVATGGLKWLGKGFVSVLTAPFRFTGRVLGLSKVEDEPFELQESPSGRSP